jgi:hypothetical protein
VHGALAIVTIAVHPPVGPAARPEPAFRVGWPFPGKCTSRPSGSPRGARLDRRSVTRRDFPAGNDSLASPSALVIGPARAHVCGPLASSRVRVVLFSSPSGSPSLVATRVNSDDFSIRAHADRLARSKARALGASLSNPSSHVRRSHAADRLRARAGCAVISSFAAAWVRDDLHLVVRSDAGHKRSRHRWCGAGCFIGENPPGEPTDSPRQEITTARRSKLRS